MKNYIKLTLLLLALLLPAVASAYDFEVDGIYYEIYGNEVTVTHEWSYDYGECEGGDEYHGQIIIPSTVDYYGRTYTVTAIGFCAFSGCTGLTGITIPNSVTTIDNAAFSGCSGLTSITIPNSVTSIGESAFANCSGLTNATIGNSVTSIGYSAFFGCSGLTSITIPNSVTSLYNSAFSGCSGLMSIIIPNSVTSIDNATFSGCSGLTSITVSSGNTRYDSRNNCNAIIETATNTLISGCMNTVIPNSVTTIGFSAFSGCTGLTSVTIPNSVTTIGYSAFEDCSGLTSMTIGNSVTSIGESAFSDCSGLTSITIGNSVTSIGSSAFKGCSGLETVNYYAVNCNDFNSDNPLFDGLNISTINIGDNVQKIPNHFTHNLTHLATITIPDSVTSIGHYAFLGCSGLETVNFNAVSCADLFSRPFNGLNISTINIGNRVQRIPAYFAYGLTHLATIIIPNSVTSIGDNAFRNCSGLTSITIPNFVTFIGSSAFQGCSGLETLNYNAISCADFSSTASNRPFYNLNISSINIGDSVERIPAYFAYGLTQLTTIAIGNSVTTIGSYAFYGCSDLTRVDISDIASWCGIDFSSVGSNPLYYAHHLYLNGSEVTDLTIPNSVTTIGYYAFCGCSGLTSVTIPNSVTSIRDYAFDGCSGLTSITIPNSVTSIGNSAFRGCRSLTNVTIGDSVMSIGNYAFYDCSALASVTIPSSVTSIGDYAFNNSPAIETVTCMATTPPSWTNIAMFTTNVYNHSPLYVPMESVGAYKSDQCWGQFITILGIGMNDEVLVTGISLNQSQMSLVLGGTSHLVATVLPDSTTNKSVTWVSSEPGIASVDNNGLVTAIAPGTATITATTTDGTNLSASCVVTVTEDVSNYDNYLSMNDSEAFHGDTIVIPVAMTNDASIISFQTDIYLPDGLELLQEDGEYMIDPSSRMTRTHSIISNDVSSGAVRVLCYSSNYKPFTGESGDDLFYLTVKVADDAEGDYVIQLKNTLFTTSDFDELSAPDIAANVNVKAYLLGDANNSGTVTVTDVVVTSQYVLEMNPQPFVFEAADVNIDGSITVTDVSRIAWMVLNPTQNAPRRAPVVWNNGDCMSGSDISLSAGETRRVSIVLDNEMDYSAFQLDVKLPAGLTASNFALTDRASGHAFDVNTLRNGNIRALCYSPALKVIGGHEGALLTFDVTATSAVEGDITVDGIELVTAACQTVRLDAFTIGVTTATGVNELATGKTVAQVDYFNLAGQQIDRPDSGVTLVVTTYTDGTRTATKVIR